MEMTAQSRNDTLRFLKAHEGRCVALTEKVLRGVDTTYILVEEGQNIAGAFSLSRGGTILHCLPFALKLSSRSKARIAQATELLSPFFAENEIFCINGEADGTMMIENAIRLAASQEVLASHAYYRMEYDGSRDIYARRESEKSAQAAESEVKEERATFYGLSVEAEKSAESAEDTVALKDTGTIIKCTVSDAPRLVPLQLQYDKVEVLLDGMEESEDEGRLALVGKLKTQDIYADVLGGEVVAKAGTNARGINWVQIGGVYTKPLYRKLGIAGKLVSHIARRAAESEKQTALFVKELNTLAIHAYERAGFVRRGSWRIVYFAAEG